jgi:hypothetical protein
MKLNSKLTGGLAWAGLILVLAVPSADMLTKGSGGAAATMTSDMDAIDTATATPAVTPAAGPKVILARPGEAPVVVQAQGEDPVDEYLGSGKELPSYISDAPADVAAAEPAPVTKLVVPGAASQTDAVDVAAVDPAPAIPPQAAPVPYPASMRPKAPVMTAIAPVATDEEAPLILDEDLVERREAAVAAVLDDGPVGPPAPAIVRGEELEEWDSGSLADYLERRGLMNSSSSDEASSGDFDEDGFFLDEGPNDDEERLRQRLRREGFFF